MLKRQRKPNNKPKSGKGAAAATDDDNRSRSSRTDTSLASAGTLKTRQTSNVSSLSHRGGNNNKNIAGVSSSSVTQDEIQLTVNTAMEAAGGISAHPVTDLSTPVSLRERSPSQPIDLDELVDTMADGHHATSLNGGNNNHNNIVTFVDDDDDNSDLQLPDVSPAGSYDTNTTVPLHASRSFNSFNSSQSRTSQLSESNYLPVSLQSPSNNNTPSAARNNSSATASTNSSFNKNNASNTTNNPNKVVIEHKNNMNSNGNKSMIGLASTSYCLVKSFLPVLLIIALGCGAASIYGWLFKFPTLNKQVIALEEQITFLNDEIDRLKFEVNRLEYENDRYSYLNDALNVTVYDMVMVQDDLNTTVIELEDVAVSLNTTKEDLLEQIDSLRDRNREYEVLNSGLSKNLDILSDEVKYFQDAFVQLTKEHDVLKNTTVALENLANQFYNTTINQNETLTELQSTLNTFKSENDRLEDFNKDLLNGLDYLNTTLSQGIDTSLEEITAVLGEQVQRQQLLTLKQLEIGYRQLIQNWDCDYRDVFVNEPYGTNFDIPMIGYDPNSDIMLLPANVMTYIEERVLSKLCLSSSNDEDFLRYLHRTNTDLRGMTSNQLIRSVMLYTDEAMKYYFPTTTIRPAEGNSGGSTIEIEKLNDDDNTMAEGIEIEDWINAGYRCELLPRKFQWTGVTTYYSSTATGRSGEIDVYVEGAAEEEVSKNDDDNDNDNNNGLNLRRPSTYTLNPAP